MKYIWIKFLSFIYSCNFCVILLTIDGVRWQEIFNGTDSNLTKNNLSSEQLLPNITSNFVGNGIVIGKNSLVTISNSSHYSLPGYLEIVRGHPTLDCDSNICLFKHEKTILDDYRSAVFSSWAKIGSIPSKNTIINSGRIYRNESWKKLRLDDYIPNEFIGPDKYRADNYTEIAALQYLVTQQPELLWISLGDTDEWAHLGNYNKYISSLQNVDNFIGVLFDFVNTLSYYKDNTTVILVTDHGRGNAKKWTNHSWIKDSERVWLMMAGKGVPDRGYVTLDKEINLSLLATMIKNHFHNEHIKIF